MANGAESTTAGQAIHLNATLRASLPHGLWFGANGYYLKQITAPEVNGEWLLNSKEQVGALGPGLLWDKNALLLYVNVYKEFGAVSRSQGARLCSEYSGFLESQ